MYIYFYILDVTTVYVCPSIDIAVGSPYEANSDNNSGTVYIFYGKGSEDGLISRFPDQVSLCFTYVRHMHSYK